MKKFTLFFLTLIVFISLTQKMCFGQKNVGAIPEWTKKAVWYQIFPERFYNGDTANDPKPADIKDSWPHFVPANWEITPWTSDWYELQSWEKANGHDFYWNAGTRRYGGDLEGVIKKLDYLVKLGINAIYFNPLFESPSLHKYDASMYRHIDNNFGPNPNYDRKIFAAENPEDESTWRWTTADSLFLKLIKEAHKRNIKVIIDGVFNHVGTSFWAFKDLVKNQQRSKYKDWFIVKKYDDPKTKKNEFDYKGWYGIKDLPEFREDENGLVKPVAEYIHKIVKRWMDPNSDGNPEDGIDGWRLDVAEMVNHKFWKKFRRWVKEINSNAYITGEVWWENWQEDKMFNAAAWLQGDEFDAVMNYRFARAVKKFVADVRLKISPQAFVDSLQNEYKDYGENTTYSLMNLLDSHDTERIASMIVNPDVAYDHNARPTPTNNWNVRKPTDKEREKEKLMIALQMTLPGAPMIYYGDEAGMWGGDDPDDRKPMVWPEFKYEDETHHPFNKKRPADKVFFDSSIFNWYRKMISLKKKEPSLSVGKINFGIIKAKKELLYYTRTLNADSLTVVINNNKSSSKFSVTEAGIKNECKDLISGKLLSPREDFTLPPYGIAILKGVKTERK